MAKNIRLDLQVHHHAGRIMGCPNTYWGDKDGEVIFHIPFRELRPHVGRAWVLPCIHEAYFLKAIPKHPQEKMGKELSRARELLIMLSV
jgi:hypothetical protein